MGIFHGDIFVIARVMGRIYKILSVIWFNSVIRITLIDLWLNLSQERKIQLLTSKNYLFIKITKSQPHHLNLWSVNITLLGEKIWKFVHMKIIWFTKMDIHYLTLRHKMTSGSCKYYFNYRYRGKRNFTNMLKVTYTFCKNKMALIKICVR